MSYRARHRSIGQDEESNALQEFMEDEDEVELEEDVYYGGSRLAMFLFPEVTGFTFFVVALALLFTMISGLTIPLMSVLLGAIFDTFALYSGGKLTDKEFTDHVSYTAVRLVLLGVTTIVTSGMAAGLWTIIGEAQAYQARKEVLDGLLMKELEWFDRRKKGVGAIVAKTQMQIKELETAISENFGNVAQAFAIAIIAFGIAMYNSMWLTFVIMAGLPFTFAILHFLSLKIGPLITTQKDHLSSAAKCAHRTISAIKTVKLCNGQPYELGVFSKAIYLAGNAYLSQACIEAAQLGIVKFVALGMFLQGFYFGGKMIWTEHEVLTNEKSYKLTTGEVITTFWSCLIVVQNIQGMVPYLQGLEKGRLAALGLKSMARRTKVAQLEGYKLGQLQGNIIFHNVSFVYSTRPSHMALHKVSLTIAAHRTTWIVGRSGSGKSTLGSLILKAYSPTSGLITFGGRLLEQVDNEWLRQNVTLVQQNSVLFNDTVFNNIALGKGDDTNILITLEEVKVAMKLVGGYKMVMDMEKQWDTVVGPGGGKLSGGQRQRIILARAILRESPYLILDEALSSIDQTRAEDLAAICAWRKDRTTVIITHDILPIPDQDYVYCLDAGAVIEHGTRKDLEKRPNGYFSEFMRTSRDIEKGYPGRKFSVQPEFADDMKKQPIPSGTFSSSVDTRALRSDGHVGERPLTPVKRHLRRKFGSGTLDISALNTPELSEKPDIYPETPHSKQLEFIPIDLENLTPGRGRRLLPNPPEKVPEINILTHYQILANVWSTLNRKHRLLLMLGSFSALVNAAATPIFSFSFSGVLNAIIQPSTSRKEFSKWCYMIFITAIVDGITSFSTSYILHFIGQRWTDFHKVEGFTKILAQPQEWFDMPQSGSGVSGLVEDLEKHAEQMKVFVSQTVGHIFIATLMMALGTTLALMQSWKLTLIAISFSPAIYIFTRGLAYFSEKAEETSNQAAQNCGTVMMEAIENIVTVKFLGMERYFKLRYDVVVSKAWKAGLNRSFCDGVALGTGKAVMAFALATLFHFGAIFVARKEYNVESILRVFTLMSFCMANAAILLTMIPQVANVKDTSRRVLRLSLSLPALSHENHGILRPSRASFKGHIEFKDTTFNFPGIPTAAVSNINLSIPPGPSTTYFTGPSGCGKSTLCTTLLTRLYPPLDGLIHIDDLPISRYDIKRFRELVCVVPQNPTLFPGLSVRENIFYGLGDARQSELERNGDLENIARTCDIHYFITRSLPLGYDTILTQGGSGGGDGLAGGGCSLSGGQVRRIAMVRAMIREPRILVLDEPWCGLDVDSEMRVGDGVRKWAHERGVGVVVVTHGGGLGVEEEPSGRGLIVAMEKGRVVGFEKFG
ncbi:P-loop containing nucleoside triphosphate hydrolase protein [Peziza echinospora]|nr:P-loop containing nucleoside triphosphate hydrolase protein [Peziza echinospora]